MAKLTRVTAKVFGENASLTVGSSGIGQFGSAKAGTFNITGNVATIQALPAWSRGFRDAVTASSRFPALEEMTGIAKVLSYQNAYVLQEGIPEWDAGTTYNIGSIVKVLDESNKVLLYQSIINDNLNTPVTNYTAWEKVELGGGSSRNIGEIVPSTIPLTDAGLHLLDGALIQYGSYSSFVDYIADLYNDTKTYNSSAFTVVGSPTITSDGIASGFSTNDYLLGNNFSFNITNTNSWEIEGDFTTGSNISTAQYPFSLYDIDGAYGIGINTRDGICFLSVSDSNGVILDSSQYVNVNANTRYKYKVTYDSVTGYKFYLATYGNPLQQVAYSSDTRKMNYGSTGIKVGRTGDFSPRPFLGSIDLKEVQISTDGVTVFSGAKTDWSCLESEWQQSVTDYGVCGKFVYNSTNNTVRLPKYGNQIWTGGGNAPVKGNGKTLGLTNGSQNFGLAQAPNDYNFSTNGFDVNIGASATANAITNNLAIGVTTDGTKSGIITDLENITTAMDCYYYIVIATSTKTDMQVDIDEIATDLANKLDKDGSNVATSLSNIFLAKLTPDYANGITQTSTGTTAITYTCPSVGWVNYSTTVFGGTSTAYVRVNNVVVNRQDGRSNQICQELTGGFPVIAGDVVEIIPTYNSAASYLYFFPLKGV